MTETNAENADQTQSETPDCLMQMTCDDVKLKQPHSRIKGKANVDVFLSVSFVRPVKHTHLKAIFVS